MQKVKLLLPPLKDKQELIYKSTATEILLGGDTRSGKSFYIRWAYIHYAALIPGIQMDIFRLHFDDVVAENQTGETSFPILLDPWVKAGLVKITQTDVTFWNDSHIGLHHCSDDVVLLKHRGIACHVRTFGEATQILEHRLRALTGWVTMSEEMKSRVPAYWKGQFPKVIYATNPTGISAGHFRKNFVDCRPPYSIEKVGQFQRQYIPMFLDDNNEEDAEATRARIREAFPDEQTQRAYINEDKSGVSNWHAGGGEFFPEWVHERHVVPSFHPPHWWFQFRCMDLGYAEPTCVLWFAVSDGEPFRDEQGRERWYPRGCLVAFREWYICDPKDPSKGLRLRNEEIRDGIIARTEPDHRLDVTLTDSLPFQDRGGESVPNVFWNKAAGIALTKGDTSRVVGWNQLRSRLIGVQSPTLPQKDPMIVFCDCCKYTIDYMPALPRHPSESKKEDAAEHGEATHAPDTVRLAAMAHTVIKDAVQPLESRIIKEIALSTRSNTMKHITKSAGAKFFK